MRRKDIYRMWGGMNTNPRVSLCPSCFSKPGAAASVAEGCGRAALWMVIIFSIVAAVLVAVFGGLWLVLRNQ